MFGPIDVQVVVCIVATMAEGQKYRVVVVGTEMDAAGQDESRQPLEALMKGAWTHEQIITAWYWRAQSCYYSFVMANTKTFVYAGPTLANLPLCLPRLQSPSTGTCTKPQSSPSFPASSILRPIAYPTVFKHMLSLARLLHFSPLCSQSPAHMQLP